MAGSATLDPTILLDSLIPVADSLRTSLHDSFGVRGYLVATMRRTWSGRQVGEGIATDVINLVNDPTPRVHIWNGLRFTLEPCGLDEVGMIKLTEWSLTYLESEVIGPSDMGRNEEWLVRLSEAHGQAIKEKFFIHTKPPFKDREKDISWVCWLRSAR